MNHAHALLAPNSYVSVGAGPKWPRLTPDNEERLLILIIVGLVIAVAVAGCGTGEYSKVTTCSTHSSGVDKRVCAVTNPPPERKPLVVDPRLQPYLNSFLADAQAAGRDTPRFGDVDTIDVVSGFGGEPPAYNIPGGSAVHVIGLCSIQRYLDGSEVRRVHILDELLDPSSDPILLQATTYHELGHCFLDLGHTPLGQVAIMSPIAVDVRQLTDDWSRLVRAEMAQPAGDPTRN